MKLELDANPSAFPFIDNDFANEIISENGFAESESLLEKGIEAAKQGNRAQAKQLLVRVTEAEPANEDALMWLASISEYPEELLGHLHTVLRVNPNNERASEWAKSTKTLLAKDFLERGIETSKNSRNEAARQNFLQAVAHDQENEVAWLWLATVSDSVEEKNQYLRNVLNLNPENENALLMLKSVKNQNVEQLFVKAVTHAVSNNFGEAAETLEKVLRDAPGLEDAWILKSFLSNSFDAKIDCYEKILEINADSPLANVNWTSLLEIMARAETADDNDAQFSAASDSGEIEVEKADHFGLANEMPEAEPDEKTNYTVPESNPSEFSAELPETAAEEHYFEAAASAVDEVKTEESTEDYFVTQAEADGEPPIEMYYNSPADEDDSVLSLQFQPKNDEENSAHSEPDGAHFENAETPEFPAYSEIEELKIAETQSSSVSYYEADENYEADEHIFSSFAAETDSLPALEEAAPDDSAKSRNEEAHFLSEEPMRDEEEILEMREDEAALEARENETENMSKLSPEMVACPFCKSKHEPQEFVCNSCHSMLTLSDLEMLLAHQGADRDILQYAVEELEAASEHYDFDADEFKTLGIGHINLKNFRLGFTYLQDALKLNPNDVVLSSQVNALAIRLAEMDQQESIHSSMPKNRKILVVDDSATVRKLISGKLEKSGHEVLCAVDGIEALEKINETVPDLILLDINMPRMDGYQVCKMIRNNEATKDVPVVMISGKDGFFDKVRGRMAGTTGYITKPFGPETLMKTVETYIV